MTKTTRRSLFALPFLANPQARLDRDAAKEALEAREKIRRQHFPNVTLLTHDGKPVKFYDDLIKGKIVMINVMYAECEGVCPGITANLVKVQKLLGSRVGKEIFMYSITLKPEQDTPKVLREYRQMYGITPGWTYLTGKAGDVELLRQKLGFTTPNPITDKDTSQHIGNVRFGNEPLMLWGACPGSISPKFMIELISHVIHPEAALKKA
jgi:protein SCO1/2